MKKNILFMLCCLCISVLQAQKPERKAIGGWQILGTTNATHNEDHEATSPKIPINVKKLKFAVRDQELTITKVVILYDTGEEETLVMPMTIQQNGEGPTVDIKSGMKNIKKIDFWYDSTDFVKGKAEVTIFGRK